MVEPFETYVNLASFVPGIQRFSIIWVIAEIGTDMSVFQDTEHLVFSACITTNILKSWCLYKGINNSIRDCSNSYYKHKYESIKRRHGHKKAIRMMLTAIYHMFSSSEIWNPYDLNNINNQNQFGIRYF